MTMRGRLRDASRDSACQAGDTCSSARGAGPSMRIRSATGRSGVLQRYGVSTGKKDPTSGVAWYYTRGRVYDDCTCRCRRTFPRDYNSELEALHVCCL
jgi:hypothetical protein